ncbi:glycogen-branching enzyme [Roseobacter denitrificans]|uniref:1,4-alpha-glucan branching enzyme GlgB n=1 Tax=Roseobacter denitrificans (strain ATCC 33942 / OCh 114) TaxID=375451 RepID=GLGB_ROSDO|nr:1,4-alpha-glucan branching protein GlgB [Roseobacter denitrificans]Q165E2.1 RecName: Full=1,4-alpha-glucan branching enzyme GlgB; AltName: Full=1,4-alpha-D-glucan:1,4-alpha-D-glucan 6-glucosyl-transferase; AltName: Full=Alpha-(1->4)-glucan branching enzyme; AltName: Full=Glycogen branching enzyme; Short=BE [Roseobacter denitrificans OCh 114]ABG32401.1 1,4-alpha-glucan branching enzyme [Roseobacter denitrificans OCh 114]AVL51871.1 glycogen-branching enzyme [Roseobacter denitrificans]SFF81324.
MNISQTDAEKLAAGCHGNPFSVLGLHEVAGKLSLRVFLPGAETVEALDPKTGRVIVTLNQTETPGLFEGTAARRKKRFAYHLRITQGAHQWQMDDPYRFGPVIGDIDEYLLGEGSHRRLWSVLGAHVITHEGVAGTHFAVWAPNAQRVSVVGEFNVWDGRRMMMRQRGATGVWEIFVPGIGEGEIYKYEIIAPDGSLLPQKADPVGFGAEHPPRTGSVVRKIDGYAWDDAQWMTRRADVQRIDQPVSIYEVHLGSWRRVPEDGNRPLSYVELADQLVAYVKDMGFTHMEVMPVSEFPFDGSWGYQPIGLFAPTIRHGTLDEFRALVAACHRENIGVILDWVPGHFPEDAHGLGRFDGTALYEHADRKEGFHPDWNTLVYNYGRAEVANYLAANALYWLQEHHVDGLRVDAVASMLYRDYSRKDGEWIPNRDGGRENYEAISFLQKVNTESYGEVPGIMTIAEESTAFPGVSAPVDAGGLGFGFKWNMGWMNDTLQYMQQDPIHRKYHHHEMTFGLHYAFSENFILPLSHDEVVHGKGSLLDKMPGQGDDKFANLRAYYGFMWGHPGKKLLFMGCEFAQGVEWNHDSSLDWHLLDHPQHRGMQNLVRDLNALYRENAALHGLDCAAQGFEWIDENNAEASVLAWLRHGPDGGAPMLVVSNFTPVERSHYRLGVPQAGRWVERLNTNADCYGGTGLGNLGGVQSADIAAAGRPFSIDVVLPPLTTLFFQLDDG